MLNASLRPLLQPIRLLAMDVDGVLTDGSITWAASAAGEMMELKSFSVRDGLGIGLVQSVGIEIAWITGRASEIVLKRAGELKVRHVLQGARDKRRLLVQLAERLGLAREQILYIGDDLNDVPAFEAAGVCVTVADAPDEIKSRAQWVTEANGGRGAVREVVEELLKAQGRWDEAVDGFLQRLREEQDRVVQ